MSILSAGLAATVVLAVRSVGGFGDGACATAAACYELGRRSAGGDRRQHFREGISLARSRLAQNPDDPEGLYWAAVNIGAEALERGKLRALPALPEMERLLLACHRVAPGYEHAGAARVLGRLYHKAPAVISIGSTAKARQWLETAVTLEPDYPGNLAFAADFYADQRDRLRALPLARRCLAVLDARPGSFGPEGEEWRTIARAIVEAGS
jgi:hypothetical protein